jgi:uncharacterized protein
MRPLPQLPILCLLLAIPLLASPEDHYRKIEARIPMRDGIRLYTAIYVPREPKGPFPILLNRTPYSAGPYGPEAFPSHPGPSEAFRDLDYAFVHQDVRGRFLSEGSFVDERPVLRTRGARDVDEGTDTYDTIAWLLEHLPGNNGRVGMWGISYPGHYVVQGMRCGHPALVAVSPQAPMIDTWEGDDWYHRGAFQLAASFSFFLEFRTRKGPPTDQPGEEIRLDARDGYRYFLEGGPIGPLGRRVFGDREPLWDDGVQHTSYDSFWQIRDLRPHIRDIRPAVLTVGGWFDAEDLFGALACARALRTQSPATRSHLVMGPWTHGQWASSDGSRVGTAQFGQNTSAFFQQEVELRFFEHHLRGSADPKLAAALVFETGTNRWRSFEAWPPSQAVPRTLYFQGGGGLAFQAPEKAGSVTFVSDPAQPVPYTQATTFGYIASYMTEDQAFAAVRPDVVTFQTGPLEADLCLAGPLRPVLRVSTTGTDSDWVVKLIDVIPEGPQMLVRGDVIRGKYRDSFSRPEPFRPGQPTEVAFTLNDICHTFRRGHRVMIQVQCSWFPLVDRNPQTFCDIPWAKPEAFRQATQRVFLGGGSPSRVEVLALK